MITTLLFDIYQTLIDIDLSQKNLPNAWKVFDNFIQDVHNKRVISPFEGLVGVQNNNFYKKHDKNIYHRDFREDIREALYKNYDIKIEESKLSDLIWQFRNKSRAYYKLYPQVKETLKKLSSKYKLAVASIGHASYTVRELDELGIKDYFSYLFISSSVGYKKPSVEFFKSVLEQTNSRPNETIMIGDNLRTDIWGAQQLNIWTIYIRDTIIHQDNNNEITPNKTVSINNFKSLPKIVSEINEMSNQNLILGMQKSSPRGNR